MRDKSSANEWDYLGEYWDFDIISKMELHIGNISSSAVPFGASEMSAEISCATARFTAMAEIKDTAT